MGNYRPFLQGPLPVANYTRIIIPGRFWTRPPSTKSTRMASSATPLHDSLIELAIPDAHAHAIKWYLNIPTNLVCVFFGPIPSLLHPLIFNYFLYLFDCYLGPSKSISSFSSPLSSKLMRAGGGNGRQYV